MMCQTGWDFKKTIQIPLELSCHKTRCKFWADKDKLLSKKLCISGLLIIAVLHGKGSTRGSGANEGQIYAHDGRDLSCLLYVDGCAATSKLSHNAGLNRSAITSFRFGNWSSIKYALCWQAHSISHSVQPQYVCYIVVHKLLKGVYFYVTCSWNYALYMGQDFHIVTSSSIKLHKSTCVNGYSVRNKLCVHVWVAWQVQMSTLTFLSGCGQWVRYWIYN